jgi:hypothetical protein
MKPTIRTLSFCLVANLFGLCFGIVGCSPDGNFLEGSISRRFAIEFDFVELRQQAENISILYQDNVEYIEVGYEATNTVAELVISQLPAATQKDEWLDVTETIEINRYVIIMPEKYMVSQDERPFPEINHAEAVFFDLSEQQSGTRVCGQFSIGFIDGSTLRGGFEGRL